MTRTPEKQARVEAMLGEVAELSLVVVRELAVRLRETEDVDQAVALAEAFQKATRAMRLTLALDAKLDRDAERDARDAALQARKAEAAAASQRQLEAVMGGPRRTGSAPAETRKARVQNLLNRLIWNEFEGDSEQYAILLDDLSARLDEAALSDGFQTLPIEVLAGRVIKDMGISGELTLSLGERPVSNDPAPQPQLADTG